MGKDGGGTKSKGKGGGGGGGALSSETLLGPLTSGGVLTASAATVKAYHNGQKQVVDGDQMFDLLYDAGASTVFVTYPDGSSGPMVVMPSYMNMLAPGTVVTAADTIDGWKPLTTALVAGNKNDPQAALKSVNVPSTDNLPKPPKTVTMKGANGDEYKAFTTIMDAQAHHQPAAAKWIAGLEYKQRQAAESYTGVGYEKMNAALRNGTKKPSGTNALIEALNRPEAVVQENIVVRRNFKWGGMAKLTEGDTFTDKGFTSTSVSPTWDWSGYRYDVLVPKGAKGAYVASISKHKAENEFLLQAGTTFRIVKKAKLGDPGVLEVVVK